MLILFNVVMIVYWQKPALIVHADAVEPVVLILDYIYTQAAKALVCLHIYTGLHEPSFLETVLSTKIKCAGSFDLFFALQSK